MTKILEETLLTRDFTFGFELEGIVDNNSSLFDEWRSDNAENYYHEDEGYEIDDYEMNDMAIKDYLDGYLYGQFNNHKRNNNINNDSSVHNDSSVQRNDEDYDGYEFEYSSPVLQAVPENFARVVHMLRCMRDDGIYTNSSCGFHHHIRFSGMTPADLVWIYCNLATDAEAYELFSTFKSYEFSDEHYASFRDIDNLGEALVQKDFVRAFDYINNEKYRAFRLHPQGTLEWRGPRNFLNKKNIDEIVDFYKLFNLLIKRIKMYMDSKTLKDTTITRKELFDEFGKISVDVKNGEWSDIVEDDTRTPKSIDKLLYRMRTNQYLILKIMKIPELDRFFRKIFSTYNYRRLILEMIERDVIDYKFYKPQEISQIMDYLKSIYKEMYEMTPYHIFLELDRYRLVKYAFSEKELNDILEHLNTVNDYINMAISLLNQKIDILTKDKIYDKIVKILQNTETHYSVMSILYTLSNVSFSIQSILTEDKLFDIIKICLNKLYEMNKSEPMRDALNIISNNFQNYIQKNKEEWNSLVKKIIDIFDRREAESFKKYIIQ